MDNKKIVSIDFEAMRQKAKEKALVAAASLKEKVSAAAESVTSQAKGRKDKAFSLLLDKGIELSQKQLSALTSARQKIG